MTESLEAVHTVTTETVTLVISYGTSLEDHVTVADPPGHSYISYAWCEIVDGDTVHRGRSELPYVHTQGQYRIAARYAQANAFAAWRRARA